MVLHEVKLTGSESTVSVLAMQAVVVVSSEPLATQPAVVRFLPGVKSLVVDQNCLLRKSFPTEGTLLLFDSRACLLVRVEVVVGAEIFKTNIAGELVLRLVGQQVLVQTPFPSSLKLFPTDGTLEKGSVVLQSFVDLVIVLMSPPTELTFKLPVAPIALIGHFLAVDLSLVSLQLDLLSEPFLTVRTAKLEKVPALLLVLHQAELVRKHRVTDFAVSFVLYILHSPALTFTGLSLDLLRTVFQRVLVLALHHLPTVFIQLCLNLGAALYDDLLSVLLVSSHQFSQTFVFLVIVNLDLNVCYETYLIAVNLSLAESL